MRLPRRRTTKLTRLLLELDRASTEGRFRRRTNGAGRVSLLKLST